MVDTWSCVRGMNAASEGEGKENETKQEATGWTKAYQV